jgi:serine/threonine-protein kinase
MSERGYEAGDVVMGKYRIDRVLGRGNMGIVLAATHLGLEQRVAIKLMLPGKAADEQHARFLREARAAARLSSQHAVKVLDVSMGDGAPYMVMEYLDGRDLAGVLEARGPLPVEDAVEYVLQACEAIAEAHAAGIIHRDIKPANLFLTTARDGAPCVKVVDFGISKVSDAPGLTGDLRAMGSPLYMAPEHMRAAKSVDPRADVWALGVTLYELLAGRTPFHGETIQEVCTRVALDPPMPLGTYRADVPAGLTAVLGQSLEKDRERRFPSVAAFAAALSPYAPERARVHVERAAHALGQQAVPARPTTEIAPAPVMSAPSATSASATSAVMSRSTTMPEIPMARGNGAKVLAGAAVVVAGIAATVVLLPRFSRSGAPAAAGSGAATTVATASTGIAPAPSPPPPPDTGPKTTEPSATPTSAPTAAPTTSARTPPVKPKPQGGKPAEVPPAPPPRPPAPKPTNTTYDL